MIEILAMSFGADAETPAQHGPGVTIRVAPHAAGGPGCYLVRGACRVPAGEARAGRLELPHGIFMTAIETMNQRPATAPVVGDRLIFEEDVTSAHGDYIIEFRCLVSTARLTAGACYLHASFFEHVSNVVRVGG
jgi:hypothetical protein